MKIRKLYQGIAAAAVTTLAMACIDTTGPSSFDSLALTQAFAPAADAYVNEGAPTQAYGSAPVLEMDTGPARNAYLRFSVQGLSGTVTKAVLRLYVLNGSSGGPHLYATAPWTQAPTWATRPAVQGASVAHLAGASSGVWAELDVTALVKGNGEVYLGLLPSSSDGLDLASMEHADATRRPQLVVTTSDTEPPSPSALDPASFVPGSGAIMLTALRADGTEAGSYTLAGPTGMIGRDSGLRMVMALTVKTGKGSTLL